MSDKLPSVNSGRILSTTRCRVLALVCDAALRGDLPPTARELARLVGITVKNTHHHLCRLRDDGLVTFEERKARTARPSFVFVPNGDTNVHHN